MSDPIVLSARHVQPLLQARRKGEAAARTSLDLGLSLADVLVDQDGVTLPDGQRLSWETIEDIAEEEAGCFEIRDGEALKIQAYSEDLDRFYSLYPTASAPTLLVSGIPMHRIQEVDPRRDTLLKLRTIAPLAGRVLDTCTGLGYTAIEAARSAHQVLTVELDPVVLEIAGKNPWSRRLFDERIVQRVGDVYDVVETLPAGEFDRIIHDPPTLSLAGDLYSGAFYRELYRVLARRGRLFHYVGDLESRSGRNVVKGVVRRLEEAGFPRVVRRPEAFGVVAYPSA